MGIKVGKGRKGTHDKLLLLFLSAPLQPPPPPLPHDFTMMDDTASLFSDTSTLYDVPILHGDNTQGLIPAEECFVMLFVHHDLFKAEPGQFTRAGLPAVYDRVNQPGASRTKLAKVNLKRQRLQVQFPKESLQHATIDHKKQLDTLQQVATMVQSRKSATGKLKTMFDSLEEEMVGIMTRRIMDVALAVLFRSTDVRNPILYYPASSVLLTPKWAVSKERGMATAEAQWATISFLSPATTATTESKEEAEKRYLENLRHRETDEEILNRLFTPDERSKTMLRKLLDHLETRGAIWSTAGQATRPTIKNSIPRDRPEFIVLGLYPKNFFNRCKAYHRKGDAMPSDLLEDGKSKYAPLITSLCRGESRTDGKQALSTSPSQDFLEGWTIRTATAEPYKTGQARHEVPLGMYMGAAMGAC